MGTSSDNTPRQYSVYPREASVMYNLMQVDREKRKKTLGKWKYANKYFTIPLYKIGLLPLVGFGRTFLLLTTIGRKSGNKRTTPLEYHWIKGEIHIFSGREEESDWFKNLKANPDKVWLRYGFNRFKPDVQNLEDIEEKIEIIKWYVKKHPIASKKLFGWDPENDDPESDALREFAISLPIIRLKNPSKS